MIRRWHDRERARLRRALNHPSTSRWENLGLWRTDTATYPEAASALAMHIGQRAELGAGDAVLDLGPGVCEEQERLWRAAFDIGRYYGWERTTQAPPATHWQHVLAVDSAYFVRRFAARIGHLWPAVTPGGTVTWSDLYLIKPPTSLRLKARLRATGALAGIAPDHWRTVAAWQHTLRQLDGAQMQFEDLTDAVLGGFVRHMAQQPSSLQRPAGLRLAYGTAALLRPLLAREAIGYGLFCVRKKPPPAP